MQTARSFDAQVTREQGRVLCALSGMLIYDSYRQFRPLLDVVDGHADVVLDLRELHFLDSHGLGMLLALKQRVLATGRAMHLVNVPPRVDKVMALTGRRPC